MRPVRLAHVVLVALVVAFGCAHMLRFTVVVDDAFIALRAARHWAEHGVPEYNVGSREWVPTSLLWVALLAGLDRLLPLPLPLIAQILGGLCGVATLVLLAVGFPGAGGAGLVAAALCAAASAWAAWPLSGMETSAFALAVTAAAATTLHAREDPGGRWPWLAGLAAGTAVAIRPDGAIVLGVALALLVTARDARRWHRVAGFAGGVALVAVPALVYLFTTFGTVLPVSYYAKVEGLANLAHGRGYLWSAARGLHLLEALPLALAALVARPTRRVSGLALAIAVPWVAWVASQGGDFMAYGRFLHPVWPLVALAAGLGLAAVARAIQARFPARAASAGALALGVGLACAWAAPSVRGPDRDAYQRASLDELAREAIGRYLAGRYSPSEWLAVKPAGIIPYYSEMRAVDFFCLTDLRAARTGQWVPDAWPGHQRMNAGRIHDLAPRVVILEARLYPLASLPPPNVTDPNQGRTWIEDPRAGRYEPATAEVVPGLWLDLFVRR